jgi:hypothetical protein
MATYDVIETTKGNDSKSSLNTGTGEITLFATRTWTISSSDNGPAGVTTLESLQLNGTLPKNGDAHPQSAILLCENCSVSQTHQSYFTAKATYKSVPFKAGEEPTDPFDQKAIIGYSLAVSEEAVDEDANGNPIETTANEAFQVQKKFGDIQVTLSQIFPVFSPTVIRSLMFTTNSGAFLGFPAGEGLITNIVANQTTIGENTPAFNVQTTMVFREPYNTTSAKTWYKRTLNRGYRYLTDQGQQMVAEDSAGNPVSTPINLDLTGGKLQPGLTPNWLEFQLYQSTDFSSLGYNLNG